MTHAHCGQLPVPVAELHHGDDEIVFDIADVCGPATWSAIHHLAENFPCGPCAEEGGSLMRFAHDLINVKLGRPVMYPDDFRTWATTVFETSAALAEHGAEHIALLEQGPAPPDILCVGLGQDRTAVEILKELAANPGDRVELAQCSPIGCKGA